MTRKRAFSLIEVLMAILILGIGVISIAALFPAGIAQQRQSTDDVLGPVVAENALAVLRSRLRSTDFGAFDDYGVVAPRPTIPGDWTWVRPSFLIKDDPDTDDVDERGAIDIFSYDWTVTHGGQSGMPTEPATEFAPPTWTPGTGYADANNSSFPPLYGVPWSKTTYGNAPPRILITRRERFYPMPGPALSLNDPPARPQYVWDVMFRRFQGRMIVAIFVYRVRTSGGEPTEYSAVPNPSNTALSPLPITIDLFDTNAGNEPWRGSGWKANNDPAIPFTEPGDDFEIDNDAHAWQLPGQWIMDQNNTIHRVLAGRQNEQNDGPVELVRPVSQLRRNPDPINAPLFNVGVFYFPAISGSTTIEDNVTDIWYLPSRAEDPETEVEYRLTPVYVTVKEL
jgi:prepilin-type N-terminal cleavage/methylation domain-containing protein